MSDYHRKIAIDESSQVHALVYIGDQIGDLIDAIKGFVKLGEMVAHVPPDREQTPKAKKPENVPIREATRKRGDEDGPTQG